MIQNHMVYQVTKEKAQLDAIYYRCDSAKGYINEIGKGRCGATQSSGFGLLEGRH